MFAFICGSPYQILLSIHFVYNNIGGSKGSSDIYIYEDFAGFKRIEKKLSQSGLFQHVIPIRKYQDSPVWYSKLRVFSRIFFPRLTLKKHIYSFRFKKSLYYDTIVATSCLTCVCNMIACFKHAKRVFLEDGLGTYLGDIRKAGTTTLYRKICSLVRKGMFYIKPDCLYANNPQLCYPGFCDCILPLPPFNLQCDPVYRNLLNSIFSYSGGKLYEKSRIIYLNQPLSERKLDNNTLSKEEGILVSLFLYKEELLIRMHPRSTPPLFYLPDKIDKNTDLWELLAADVIQNRHVLIGCFSTTQFVPKLLFDKEPYIIMTYKLLIPKHDRNYQEISNFECKIRCLYRHSEKIFSPSSLSELENILRAIRSFTESSSKK